MLGLNAKLYYINLLIDNCDKHNEYNIANIVNEVNIANAVFFMESLGGKMTERIVESITSIFDKKGFGGASEYLIIVLFFLGAVSIIWLVKNQLKRKDNLTDEMFAVFKKSIEDHSKSMEKLNEGIISEIKAISESIKDGIDNMNTNSTRANEIIHSLLEKNNEKIITAMEEDKTLSLSEFEKQAKTYFEVMLLRTNNSINERIEKNNLIKLKNQLRGSETCCYLDGELASIAKKYLIEAKEDIKNLNFQYENMRAKVLSEYDRIINNMNIELCSIFDVKENYLKEELLSASRALIMKTLNLANSISFEDL